MSQNAPYDWIEKRMADQWAEWFLQGQDARNPLISPIHADLRGLPPVYIQVGSAEILYDMICVLAERMEKQGGRVKLDIWPQMTHDFQAFGDTLPESREALARIRTIVQTYVS